MMSLRVLTAFVSIVTVLGMSGVGNLQAASFSIVYDDFGNQLIENIVGTGTFRYDGSPVAGAFLWSDLTGVTFTAEFPGVPTAFPTGDPRPQLPGTGIYVFDAGGGQFGLVFLGSRILSGPLNLTNDDGFLLTHEPTGSGNPIGCCGGNGVINLYQLSSPAEPGGQRPLIYLGDYSARAAAEVSIPASLTLIGLGVAGIACGRWDRRVADRDAHEKVAVRRGT